MAGRLEGLEEKAAGVGAALAAGAAVGAMAAHGSEVLENLQQLGRGTGEALLEVAKTLPFVAPVAYLVGAIASSAVTAVAMKADCLEFGKVVQQLEGVLVKAEDLEDQLGVVDDVRDSLEEAPQLMETLQQRGVLSSVLYSKSDKNRFEEIREKIEKAIARLNLAATVEAAAIAKAQFKQSAGLQQKVNELGGWEKVAADPDAKRALEEELSASDRLLAESISENRKTLKAVGQQVTRGLQSVEAMQKETLEKVTAGQDEAAEKLETMTQRFIDMERQSELQRMHNVNLERQVGELKSMLSDIKGAMSMFPVPAKEPERMEVLGAGGFMSPDTFKDTKVQRALQDLANEASARWSAMAMINLIGGSRQLSTACALPVAKGQVGGHDVPEAVELQQLPGNMCGLWCPRKATPCQHVVNSEKPLVFSGAGSDPRAPKFATPDELQLAAKVDPDVKLFLDKMAESKFPHCECTCGRARRGGGLTKNKTARASPKLSTSCRSSRTRSS